MIKYFNIPVTGLKPILVNASQALFINQTSTTETFINYNGTSASTDSIKLTHAADATGVAMQNFLIEELKNMLSSSYTNVAPLLAPPMAVGIIQLS